MAPARPELTVRDAGERDVADILRLLRANRGDRSLFQQPERQVRRTLGDFVLAVDGDAVCGCAALHWHRPDNAEVLAVAVDPALHGRGTGGALMRACVARAAERGGRLLWLATAKPDYFARFGFAPFSRFRLPPSVLL